MRRLAALCPLPVLLVLSACNSYQPENLALGLSVQQARGEIRRQQETPVTLARPVVVVTGWRTPEWMGRELAEHLQRCTSGRAQDFLLIPTFNEGDFDLLAGGITTSVDARWPNPGAETAEVDVVTFSAGALASRWAALEPAKRVRSGAAPTPPPPDAKRLRVARLFTIVGPNQGADIARSIHPDPMSRDMVPGSAFLKTLNTDTWPAPYPVVSYAQLGDHIVGATRTAPPGVTPIWTHGSWWGGHLSALHSPIFLADIAARLRGEMPLVEPASPPPED